MHRIKARSNIERAFFGTENGDRPLTSYQSSKYAAANLAGGTHVRYHKVNSPIALMTPTLPGQRVPQKRILLAEDEPSVAISLLRILALDGHSVEIAGDGRQALGMFDPTKHDVVITDFAMPNMDGLELAEAIKVRSSATPIILFTAYLERLKGTDGKVSNVDLLLGKPCSIMQLRGALQRIFPVA